MSHRSEAVRTHYQAGIRDRDEMMSRIHEALKAVSVPIDTRRLAGLDQFHVGGLAATTALAERVGLTAELRVLDAGSGLGGPARYLARTFGCRVEGVDLAPDYVALATMLTEHVGLADRVTFREGDLSALPFDEDAFDLVWTQHVAMNIADRAGLYAELRRVLRSKGRLAFYDVLAADRRTDLTYPVPWAESAATSTLLDEAETREVLGASGFTVMRFDDVTVEAMNWTRGHGPQQEPGMPNVATIVGPRMAGMAANLFGNLVEGRVKLVMGIAEARS